MYQKSWWSYIYSSWDLECDRLKLVIMGHFLPFYPSYLKTKEVRILKKWKNLLEIPSFYTLVPRTTIIWGTVPEKQSETDKAPCHFEPIFGLLPTKNPKNQNFEEMKKASRDDIVLHTCTKNHNHMMYALWVWSTTDRFFLSF